MPRFVFSPPAARLSAPSIGAPVRDDDSVSLSVEDVRGLALVRAAFNEEEEFVAYLLSQGVDSNAVDRDGYTALHRACQRGNHAIVRLLLRQCADLRALSPDEHTPRRLAEINHHHDLAGWLEFLGAS
jgi:ankyrin repeat protein